MADDDDRSPEEQFQEMLRRMLGGGIDPQQWQQLAAMGITPAQLEGMLQQLRGAFSGPAEGIPWDATRRQALHLANQNDRGVGEGRRVDLDEAFALASLWLSEATTVSESPEPAESITRGEWVERTLPFWQELAEPVAASIADALTGALGQHAPEALGDMLPGAERMLRAAAGAMFAAQLGQVIGSLSLEVISGGDVGLPVMPAGSAVVLPQNFADFGSGLEIPPDQLALCVAVRELAHARLFRQARWLRLDVLARVTEFARGIHVEMSALEQLVEGFDPAHPEQLRAALESGALLPPRTPAQDAALARLETVLALVEGWVDVVTADATARVPAAERVAEVVRRRRAVGGPAEKALASLVGLELRPRRMREAAAMWRAVGEAVGVAARDSLWDYPDLMPSADDIDDPTALIARLRASVRGESPEPDEMDAALARLLAEEDPGSADG